MKLLVVGASGFLGRNIVKLAARRGWDVTGTFFSSADFRSFARSLGVKAVRHDLENSSRTWDADRCIYLAGNSDHLGSVRAPSDDFRRNVLGLQAFLEGYEGGLVFFSSAAVYEGHRGDVSPATCVRPSMPYAISKMAAERYLAFRFQQGALDWVTVLRLYYGYGPWDRPSRLVPRMVEASQSPARSLNVTAPKGSLVDPLYSQDIARAALAAASGKARGETLDLCGGNPRTVAAFARVAAASQGWRLSVSCSPRPNEVPLRFYSSPRKAVKALGLTSLTTIGNGIRSYLRWKTGEET